MKQCKHIQCEAGRLLECNTDDMNYRYIVMGHKLAISTQESGFGVIFHVQND